MKREKLRREKGVKLSKRKKAILKRLKRKERYSSKKQIKDALEELDFFNPYTVERELPEFGKKVEYLCVPEKDTYDFNTLAVEYNYLLERLNELHKQLSSIADDNSWDAYAQD